VANYLTHIDEHIGPYRLNFSDWWFTYNNQLYSDREIDNARWFAVLKDLLTDLRANIYRKYDQRTRGLLTEIVVGIVEDHNYEAVKRFVWDDRPSRLPLAPPSGGAAPEKGKTG